MQLLDPGQVDFVLISHRLSRKFRTEQDRAPNANKQTNKHTRRSNIFIPRGVLSAPWQCDTWLGTGVEKRSPKCSFKDTS